MNESMTTKWQFTKLEPKYHKKKIETLGGYEEKFRTPEVQVAWMINQRAEIVKCKVFETWKRSVFQFIAVTSNPKLVRAIPEINFSLEWPSKKLELPKTMLGNKRYFW